jgi:hypothetical protein
MKTEIIKLTAKKTTPKRLLRFSVICGILSSVLYVIMNIIAVVIYNGYDPVSQTVSELSAIGAPARSFWVPLGFVYTLLVALFGWGVWQSAGNNRNLRIAGMLLLIYGLIGLGWPPMHQREVLATGGGSFTDTMHIIYSAVSVFLMLLAMWFGSRSFDKPFRFYSVVSIGILIILGTCTAIEAPKLQHNQPTPWLGILERILILIFLVWIVVLAVLLLKTKIEKYNKGEEKVDEFAGLSAQNKMTG